jgi:hypothetical protein
MTSSASQRGRPPLFFVEASAMTTTPPKNNLGKWFLLFLLVASISVAVFMIWFNLSIQLKPEQLDEAMKRWKENGPKNYKLTYTKQIDNNDHRDIIIAQIVDGKAKQGTINGEPFEERVLPYHTMDRLLIDIEKFLEDDRKPGAPKTYTTAVFDAKTGALHRYVRRVMGSTQRLELNLKVDAE